MSEVGRPIVSVVLGTYNRLPFLQAAIASVRAGVVDLASQIIVVDGGSTDGTIAWLAAQRDILTILHHNRELVYGTMRRRRSWGYFMNLGFKCAEGRYICLVSDDSVVHPDTIGSAVGRFERERTAGRNLAGLAFYWRSWPEENHYRVGITLGRKLFVNHGLFLREALAAVGWIDEDRYGFYCADGDLSLKLWDAGYEVDACEEALLEHFEHAGVALRQDNLRALESDWQSYVARWTGTFYQPDDSFSGGWLHLAGVAPRRCEHLFPPRTTPPVPKLAGGRAQLEHLKQHVIARLRALTGLAR